MSQILLVEDKRSTTGILTTVLRTEGYKVLAASVAETRTEDLQVKDLGLIVADISSGVVEGAAFINALRKGRADLPVILISDEGRAVPRLDEGEPFAHVVKPLKMDELLVAVQGAMDFSEKAMEEMKDMSLELERAYLFPDIVAESPAMRSVCEMISRIARTDVSVLVSGEKGVGKSLVARTIHNNSARKEREFVAVACAESNGTQQDKDLFGQGDDPGALVKANGGSILLAGVDSLSADVQQKLLVTLRERKVMTGGGSVSLNLRLLTSAEDLDGAVEAGSFSEGLHKHLRAIVISISPLRERPKDIRPLALRILKEVGKEGERVARLDQDALAVLEQHSWPGNVIDLKKALRMASDQAKGGTITAGAMKKLLS
jgi:two-component system response regulator AtoC